MNRVFNRTRRVLGIALTVLMMVSLLPMGAFAADPPSTAKIDGVTYYEIGTADDLYWFAARVNDGNDTINGILTADITVNPGTMTADSTSAKAWTPIGGWGGTWETSVAFNGIFDGDGHTISGLYFSAAGEVMVGLVGYLGTSGIVKNVNVVKTYFHGSSRIGTLVGYCEGSVENCSADSIIVSDSSSSGGIVGAGPNEAVVKIKNCSFRGSVTGESRVGGITSNVAADMVVEGCENLGSVTTTGNHYAGGIAANNYGVIVNCRNSGPITTKISNSGGISGTNSGNIVNCYSEGSLTDKYGGGTCGGIVGWGMDGHIYNSYYDSSKFSGALIGEEDGTTADTLSGGKTSPELASGEVTYALQEGCTVGETEYPGTVWGQNLDNGEPVQTAPQLDGPRVNYGYADCRATVPTYSNDNRLDEPKCVYAQVDYDEGTCWTVCMFCGSKDPTSVAPHEYDWTVNESAGQYIYECTRCHRLQYAADRIYGNNRSATAFAAADRLKTLVGKDRFDAMIIASGTSFADALAGSYLAAKKSAPILLYTASTEKDNVLYIRNNLNAGGTVYILGGVSAVPASVETVLTEAGVNVVRLYGNDRFATNIAILREAGVNPGDEVLVCTGYNFADSLSASATGLPILLVNSKKGTLTADQMQYLNELSAEAGMTLTIIGGEGAVSGELEDALSAYDTEISRIYGENRYETSLYISRVYFPASSTIYVAYGKNFPDGLSGGPLAYTENAPLLLISKGNEHRAGSWVKDRGVRRVQVMGGNGVVTDENILKIFE